MFSARLDRLEQYITWKPKSEQDPVQRIYALASAMLSIKEEDILMEEAYYGPRSADIVFDTPIEIKSFLAEKELSIKTGVPVLTLLIRENLQLLLSKME